MSSIPELLQLSSARHDHLCPRQVLGVRIGIAGLTALGVQAPVSKASALIIVETDGCFVDGIEAATGATVGHRTLHVTDIGKLAATFVDVHTGMAIRVAPRQGIRSQAFAYAPGRDGRYQAQLEGYQIMPEADLLRLEEVLLQPPLEVLLSDPDARVTCSSCDEEIINERELIREGTTLCRSCAGGSYYTVKETATQAGDVVARPANNT